MILIMRLIIHSPNLTASALQILALLPEVGKKGIREGVSSLLLPLEEQEQEQQEGNPHHGYNPDQ